MRDFLTDTLVPAAMCFAFIALGCMALAFTYILLTRGVTG